MKLKSPIIYFYLKVYVVAFEKTFISLKFLYTKQKTLSRGHGVNGVLVPATQTADLYKVWLGMINGEF